MMPLHAVEGEALYISTEWLASMLAYEEGLGVLGFAPVTKGHGGEFFCAVSIRDQQYVFKSIPLWAC